MLTSGNLHVASNNKGAKMLDYTGYTIANKTERLKIGISRLLIAKFEF